MPLIFMDVENLLVAALAIVLLFHLLQQPVVAGFPIAGIAIGPSGLGLIPRVGANLARALAETGDPCLALVEEGRRAGHEVRDGDGTLAEVPTPPRSPARAGRTRPSTSSCARASCARSRSSGGSAPRTSSRKSSRPRSRSLRVCCGSWPGWRFEVGDSRVLIGGHAETKRTTAVLEQNQ